MLPGFLHFHTATDLGRGHIIEIRFQLERDNAACQVARRRVLTLPRCHQQRMSRQHFLKDSRPTVVPGGDTLHRIPATDDPDFDLRAATHGSLPGHLNVQIRFRHCGGERVAGSGQLAEHFLTLLKAGSIKVLVRERLRQDPDDFLRPLQRGTGHREMGNRWGIPGPREDGDPGGLQTGAVKKIQSHSGYSGPNARRTLPGIPPNEP